MELRLPALRPLVLLPRASEWFTLKVTIAIAIALLKEAQERVAKRGIHAHAFSWVVTTNSVASKAFLEKRLFESAAAVEIAGRSGARRTSA